MDEKKFNRLKLHEKYEFLKNHAEYIGARESLTHFVYLYAIEHHFVEVFYTKGIYKVQYIEIQKSKVILDEYIRNVDIHKDLEL
jgi:hypothetical protein